MSTMFMLSNATAIVRRAARLWRKKGAKIDVVCLHTLISTTDTFWNVVKRRKTFHDASLPNLSREVPNGILHGSSGVDLIWTYMAGTSTRQCWKLCYCSLQVL
jgi:hypothetical protein